MMPETRAAFAAVKAARQKGQVAPVAGRKARRAQERAERKINARDEIPSIVARRDTKPGAREMFALRKAGWGQ